MKTYYVYIATNKNNRVLYTGVTDNIHRRMFEHENQVHPNGFTARYNVNKLVYIESTKYINNAIAREKEIKGWTRSKKLELIKSLNPEFNNLLEEY